MINPTVTYKFGIYKHTRTPYHMRQTSYYLFLHVFRTEKRVVARVIYANVRWSAREQSDSVRSQPWDVAYNKVFTRCIVFRWEWKL